MVSDLESLCWFSSLLIGNRLFAIGGVSSILIFGSVSGLLLLVAVVAFVT